MDDPCLSFKELTLGYNGQPALLRLHAEISKGSLTAIVGANGSGKSTLLKSIAGIIAPLSGECLKASGVSVAYLPQQSALDRSFPAEVRDLVSLGLWPRRGLLGRITSGDRDAIGEALATVGLAGYERKGIDALSGGQLQRALFARTILQEADLILLDEPFNAVDEKTVAELMAVIAEWIGEGRTVITVLHDYEIVRQHFSTCMLLARRLVGFGPTEEVLQPAILRQARRLYETEGETAFWCEPAEQVSPYRNLHSVRGLHAAV